MRLLQRQVSHCCALAGAHRSITAVDSSLPGAFWSPGWSLLLTAHHRSEARCSICELGDTEAFRQSNKPAARPVILAGPAWHCSMHCSPNEEVPCMPAHADTFCAACLLLQQVPSQEVLINRMPLCLQQLRGQRASLTLRPSQQGRGCLRRPRRCFLQGSCCRPSPRLCRQLRWLACW